VTIVTNFLVLASSRDAARGARYAPWRSGAPERRNGAPERAGVLEFRGLGPEGWQHTIPRVAAQGNQCGRSGGRVLSV
jgi:hypothetical protein